MTEINKASLSDSFIAPLQIQKRSEIDELKESRYKIVLTFNNLKDQFTQLERQTDPKKWSYKVANFFENTLGLKKIATLILFLPNLQKLENQKNALRQEIESAHKNFQTVSERLREQQISAKKDEGKTLNQIQAEILKETLAQSGYEVSTLPSLEFTDEAQYSTLTPEKMSHSVMKLSDNSSFAFKIKREGSDKADVILFYWSKTNNSWVSTQQNLDIAELLSLRECQVEESKFTLAE